MLTSCPMRVRGSLLAALLSATMASAETYVVPVHAFGPREGAGWLSTLEVMNPHATTVQGRIIGAWPYTPGVECQLGRFEIRPNAAVSPVPSCGADPRGTIIAFAFTTDRAVSVASDARFVSSPVGETYRQQLEVGESWLEADRDYLIPHVLERDATLFLINPNDAPLVVEWTSQRDNVAPPVTNTAVVQPRSSVHLYLTATFVECFTGSGATLVNCPGFLRIRGNREFYAAASIVQGPALRNFRVPFPAP